MRDDQTVAVAQHFWIIGRPPDTGCARAASGHAAAPSSSVMNSRRLTVQYLPVSDRKIAHLGTAGAAALRDCGPAYARRGSKCEKLALSICCPVIPDKPT